MERNRLLKYIFIVLLVNFFLFVIKFVPTIFFNSLSVQSDSFNSLSDSFYSIIILVGSYFAFRPKDSSHPHGHERIRPFLSLIISGSIIFTGVIIVRGGIYNLIHGTRYQFSILFIYVLLISILVKYTLSIYLDRLNKVYKNDILSSLSDDSKVDALASFSAIVGVIISRLGYAIFDTIFGVLISFWIFKTGLSIGWRNFKYLTGSSPPQEVTEKIMSILKNREEVIEVIECEPHYVGPKLDVYCELEVASSLSLIEAHELEEEIKRELLALNEVNNVYIHLEPT
ncbi:MAG: putative Co/Zn/Cd cation transporter [Candidatus Methanohalarchaeum thermophilum]|uniref:Co/Zn/Cd cation transporter n=1 Tax=Methanohalarchaeum thermophilum TaxID=1903181 RepID=A0A1Q6DUG8_METT1|nr:MAG: putative Co/Zn/Cd cation transporter [Candidatus Methanohalarchaeum thermophilum]